MRSLAILCVFSLLLADSALSPVWAQVTVDLHALEALPQRSGPAPRPVRPTPAPPRATASQAAPTPAPSAQTANTEAPSQPSAPAAPGTQATPIPPSPSPALPEQTPQTASISPIEPPPPAAAPPPPPVSAQSGTTAAPTQAGMRVSFADGQSDLSPDSATSIKQFAGAAPADGSATFNVQAYAPGSKDDPSSARRLSLARAMAVRSALVADGVPSARIFVRALGAQYGSGPPDRVDIDMMGDNTAAAR